MKKYIPKSVIVTLIVFMFALAPWAGGLAADQVPEGEVDHPQNEANLDYRISESPYLQLPEEMLNWPAMEPPEPGAFVESEDPTAVEIYNVATGEITVLPSDATSLEESAAGIQQVELFEGLLPPGFDLESNIESVFPPDGRSRITPTTSFPWRTVAQLFMTFPNAATGSCSGAIVGEFHVLTAGHCVYSHGNGGWASSVMIVPGMDAGSMPYNLAKSTLLRSYAGWTISAMTEHDWGIVTLDRNVGSFTGWMGRQYAPTGHSIYTGTVNTAGYPCNFSGGGCAYPKTPANSMWFDADSGRTSSDFNHWYYMDTMPGQSGSPVWRLEGGTGDRYILTVHTSGNDGSDSNHGTRFTEIKFNDLNTAQSADPPPTDKADLLDDGQTYSGFSPTAVKPGFTSIHNWSDVRNAGTAASGPFYVTYYASANTTISTGDYLIGDDAMPTIAPFTWANSDRVGVFPPGVPDGLYWVGWIIDSTGAVSEFDEGNNTAYKTAYQVLVDGTAPTNPTLINSNPPPSVWTNDNTVEVSWSGHSDGSGSGVDGFSIEWSNSPTTIPDAVLDTTGTNTTSPSLAGGDWYFHIRTLDNVGNWNVSAVHAGPFKIDIDAPTSNAVSPASSITTAFGVSWPGTDDRSGVASYDVQYRVGTGGAWTDWLLGTTSTSAMFGPTSPVSTVRGETYYFRSRARDNVGNVESYPVDPDTSTYIEEVELTILPLVIKN
jgi:V8-like Glu-specific endopeptidase